MGTAILFSKIDAVAAEFPDDVRRLQAFFAQHGVHIGSSSAVAQVADRIQDSTFRCELAGMLAALCRQTPRISYLELLGVVLLAAAGRGGSGELAYMPDLEEPVCTLFTFVTEARPSAQETDGGSTNGVPHDGGEMHEHTPFQEAPAEEVEEEAPVVGTGVERVAPEEERDTRLARALAIASEGESFEGDRIVVESVPDPEDESEDSSATAEQVRQMEAARRRRPIWAAGAGGVLLGSVLEFFVQRHPAVQTPVRASATAEQRNETKPGSSATEDLARVAELQRQFMVALAEQSKAEREARALAAESSAGADRGLAASVQPRPAAPAQDGGLRPAGPADAMSASQGPSNGSGVSQAQLSSTAATGAAGEREPANPLHSAAIGTVKEGTGGSGRAPVVVMKSAGIMAANLISSPVPAYPLQASAARVQGEVVVAAVVGRNGNVIESRVVSGPPLLRDAALNAVQHWQYRPFEVGGKPMEIITTARVEFRLDGE